MFKHTRLTPSNAEQYWRERMRYLPEMLECARRDNRRSRLRRERYTQIWRSISRCMSTS